ncbi:MAG: hypothetical protein IJK43_05185 [Prevotella sp.]|nr:hypothetical protein [Prevotella sp.]
MFFSATFSLCIASNRQSTKGKCFLRKISTEKCHKSNNFVSNVQTPTNEDEG